MLTACAGAPGDVVTSKPPSPTAASGGEAGYQVTFRAVSKRRTAPVATVTYPEASVTGGPDPTVRAAIETALRQTIDARRKEYDQSLDGEDPSDTSTQRITVTSQVRWGHLLSVEFLNETYRGGEPHPNTDLPAATVDLRTGKQVRTTDLYRDVAPVDAVLLKALTAKQTGTSRPGGKGHRGHGGQGNGRSRVPRFVPHSVWPLGRRPTVHPGLRVRHRGGRPALERPSGPG